MDAVLYIHGMGGAAAECDRYRPLFPHCGVAGLDYKSSTPWDAGVEIRSAVAELRAGFDNIILIANSIGAYYSMCAGIDDSVKRAYFISPVVDMERLITDMMAQANVTENELRERGTIQTAQGQELSWEYLTWVRRHPIKWSAPTEILYGSRDDLTDSDTIASFAKRTGARLTVMDGGEHWFHTEEQMRFLDNWIISGM